MSEEMMVPMLNRGNVRWVPVSEVEERMKKGWEKWQLQESPKEEYYPQYDRSREDRQGDDRISALGSEDEVSKILGLIAL